MAKTRAQVYEEEYVTDEGLAYWKTLDKDTQGYYKEKVLLFETYKGYELEAMAINAAWARSPIERIRTKVKDEVVRNTLWKCHRSGKVLPAKHCIITGEQAVAFEALSEPEQAFLNVERVIQEVKAHDDKITFDNIKEMLQHCKRAEQGEIILNGLLEDDGQLDDFADHVSILNDGSRDEVIGRIVKNFVRAN